MVRVYDAQEGELVQIDLGELERAVVTRSGSPGEEDDEADDWRAALLDALHVRTGIPPEKQVLLTADGATAASAASASGALVTLLKRDVPMYLFYNRRAPRESESDSETSRGNDAAEPPVEPPLGDEALAALRTASGLLENASLEKIDDLLQSSVALGRAVATAAQKHCVAAERAREQSKVQTAARDALWASLVAHVRSLIEDHEALANAARDEFDQGAALLDALDADLELLRKLPLPESVSSPPERLVDHVPVEKLLAWAEKCRIARNDLLQKVEDAAQRVNGIVAIVDARLPENFDGSELPAVAESARETLQDIVAAVGAMEERAGAADAPSSRMALQEHVTNVLPQCLELGQQLYRSVLLPAHALRAASGERLRDELGITQQTQTAVAEVQPLLAALGQQLRALHAAFLQLLHVHRMPAAFAASLVEVLRRRRTAAFLTECAQRVGHVFGAIRSAEVVRRDTFRRQVERYLPRQLVSGLHEHPLAFDISLARDCVPASETRLPDVAAADLDQLGVWTRQALSAEPPLELSAALTRVHATLDTLRSELDGDPWRLDWQRECDSVELVAGSPAHPSPLSAPSPHTVASGGLDSPISDADSALEAAEQPAQSGSWSPTPDSSQAASLRAQLAAANSRADALATALEDCKLLAHMAVDELSQWSGMVRQYKAHRDGAATPALSPATPLDKAFDAQLALLVQSPEDLPLAHSLSSTAAFPGRSELSLDVYRAWNARLYQRMGQHTLQPSDRL